MVCPIPFINIYLKVNIIQPFYENEDMYYTGIDGGQEG